MDFSPALVEGLREGMPLTVIGQATAAGRLGRVVVLARSDGRKAHLAATFMGVARKPRVEETIFGYARGSLGQLVLFCGAWPILVPLVGPRAAALDTQDVEPALRRFCELIELTAGVPLDVTLRPEGHTVDTAIEGLGRVFSKLPFGFPGSSRPGRVYEPPAGDDETIGLADVGGLEAAKGELEMIRLAVRDPEAFSAWGARPPRGILLFGPPGTGKTMLARALAREAGARFIHVKATDVVSKWYGEAERKLQEAFDWARQERPSVLFFDEIDAIAPEREGAHEATHRLVSTFLENLDGLELSEGVIVVAATNRPESVDPALTRPGRFDRLVEVPLPDRAARRAIFEIHMRRAVRQAGRQLFEPFEAGEWDRVLDASEGQSGADIAEAVRRVLETRVRSGGTGGRIAGDELLAQTFSVRRPF
jgi:hypothetical protein